MSWWFWIVIVLFILSMGSIGSLSNTQPGKALANKFHELGNLIGKTKEEITVAVGPPQSITALGAIGPGKTHVSWHVTGYHLILIFNNDICEGIALEQRSFK